MRVLVVTNLTPDPPTLGAGRSSATRSRRCELRGRRRAVLVSGRIARLRPRATVAIRRLLRREHFDLVHAHYGLAAWCAQLAGAQPAGRHLPRHRRPPPGRRPPVAPAGAAGRPRRGRLAGPVRGRGRPGRLPWAAGASAVLPCGADLDALLARSRPEARARLASTPTAATCCFRPSTSRRVKRHDRAAAGRPPRRRRAALGGRIEATHGGLDQRRQRGPRDLATTRASGWSPSRRWPATCRCSRPRSASLRRFSRYRRLPGRAVRRRRVGRGRAAGTWTVRTPRSGAATGRLVLGRADGGPRACPPTATCSMAADLA